MFRLTLDPTQHPGLLIRLEGAFEASAIPSLNGVLPKHALLPSVTLDLSGLTSLDEPCRALLRSLRSAGCRFRGGSPYLKHLLIEETSMRDPATAPSVDMVSSTMTIDADDEPRLVSRLRAGDEAAFDELVRGSTGRMLAVARRMLAREEDAQDAVQDAFLSAFKSLASFDGRSQLSTWLHRITVNACLMKLRSQKRRPEKSIEEFLPAFVADGHQRTPTPAWKPIEPAGIEEAELYDLVRSKIAELPEAYRVVLVLRDVEELSTEEAARVLGLTTNAVKTRLHRARQALRGLLEPSLAEPTDRRSSPRTPKEHD